VHVQLWRAPAWYSVSRWQAVGCAANAAAKGLTIKGMDLHTAGCLDLWGFPAIDRAIKLRREEVNYSLTLRSKVAAASRPQRCKNLP
jgi:hypothetical protein